MRSAVIENLSTFLLMAVIALTVQNTVFSRSLGISRLISLVDDTTDTFVFGILLTVTLTANTFVCYFLEHCVIQNLAYADYVRPLAMTASAIVVFLIVFVLCAKLSPPKYLKNAVSAMPLATFNCLVLGTLLLEASNKLTLAESLGFALGSSIGFIIAVLLVTEAQRKLQNRQIPPAFRGLPATLLFLSALALALYGLSGFSASLR